MYRTRLRAFMAFQRPSGERPNSSSPRRLKLRFENKLSDPVLTGKPISGVDGTDLKIELVDENTDLIVKTGPQSSGRVVITVLCADNKSDEKEGNASLPNRCTYLDLNQGIGLVGNISFPHRSDWTKKCRYMLMARFVDAFDGICVIDAKSEVFTLKDRRNQRNKKHYPPTLSDEVLRLDNIGKSFVKRLKDENIITVKNFLSKHFKNHQRLKEILNMPEKKLNETITHALTCEELKDKYIYYIPGYPQQMGIVLNVMGQLFGLISSCQFFDIETLSETQKDDARKSVASALENWEDVVPYKDDHTQPSTTCANAVLPNFVFGASNENGKCGLVPPITPDANGTLSDMFIGISLVNGGNDHTQLNTSYAKATLSDIPVETSQINGRSCFTQPSALLFSPDHSHDNCEYDDVRSIAAPKVRTPLNDTCSHPFEGTSDGVCWGLPNLLDLDIPDLLIPDANFSFDEYFGSNFSFHAITMEKPGDARKRPRL